jgi:hypothetical protein
MSVKNINIGDDSLIEVSGYVTEEWIKDIISKSNEGYRLVEGTAVAFSSLKVIRMTNVPEDPQKTPEEVTDVEVGDIEESSNPSEEPSEELTEVSKESTLDMELIESFEGDKSLLEEYGKDFGIDLKKNKKFENMLSDLVAHVGG